MGFYNYFPIRKIWRVTLNKNYNYIKIWKKWFELKWSIQYCIPLCILFMFTELVNNEKRAGKSYGLIGTVIEITALPTIEKESSNTR